MLAAEKLAFAKVEETEGTDAAPTLAENLVRTLGIDYNQLVYDDSELDIDQPYIGARPSRLRAKRAGFTMPVLCTPSGTAGEIPEGAALLRACGLAEVISEDTDVQYTQVIKDLETATVYFNQSGQLYKSLGFKGNLTLEANQGEDPLFTVTGEGSYSIATEVPFGVPDFSGLSQPLEVNASNTTFTVGGTEFDMDSFSFDAGRPLSFVSRTKQTGIKTGLPSPSASFTITAPTLAEKNFLQEVIAEGTTPIVLTHGTAKGSIMQLDLFAAQLIEPAHAESEGDLMISLSAKVRPNAAGNSWRLTYK